MTEHVHDWLPADGLQGRYICACGATGYKPACGPARGQIVMHKNKVVTARIDVNVGRTNMDNGNARRGKRGPGGW